MAVTVEQAADAGISSIEHLGYAYKASVKDKARISADFGAGRINRATANAQLNSGFEEQTAMEDVTTTCAITMYSSHQR